LVLLIHPDTRVGIAEGVGGAAGWGWRKQATSVCHCEEPQRELAAVFQAGDNVR